MGGLARELPWTYRAFLIGALALAAIPPFAGFFSKDAILSSLVDQGSLGWLLWGAGIVGAFLTGLYTFRLLFIVFFGEPTPYVREHLHKERFEGPLSMMWPVGVLAVLSLVGGFLQVPGQWHLVDTWLEPVVQSVEEASGGLAVFSILAALAAAVGGIAVAWALYRRPGERPAAIRARVPWAANALEHKLWWDEAYDAAFYRPASALANWLLGRVEGPIVLRSLGGLGTGVRDASDRVAALQTGRVRGYALALALGLAVLAVVFLWLRDHHRPHLAPDRRSAGHLGLPVAEPAGRGKLRAPGRARRAGALGRDGAQLRLRRNGPAGRRRRHLVRRPGRRLPGRPLRLLALAHRPDRSRDDGSRRLRLLDGAGAARRLPQPPALPRGSHDRRLRRPGPHPLLRLLGSHAHPALRAHRRLGRARQARGDLQVRRVHGRRLPAHARGDHRHRARRGHLRHDAAHRRRDEHLDLPRVRRRFRREGAALAVPRVAARRLPGVAARGRGGALGRHLEDGRVRLPRHRDPVLPRPGRGLADAAPRAGLDRPRLRLPARLPRARRPRRDRLLEPRPDEPDPDRDLRRERLRLHGRAPADGQPRPDLGGALPARRGDRAADDHRRAEPARRHGPRAAGARHDPDHDRGDRAGRARLERVRRRVPRPQRHLRHRLGLGRGRRDRHRPRGHVHAAADLRRPPPGAGERRSRRGARPPPRRGRRDRAARPRPARPLLLAGGHHRARSSERDERRHAVSSVIPRYEVSASSLAARQERRSSEDWRPSRRQRSTGRGSRRS